MSAVPWDVATREELAFAQRLEEESAGATFVTSARDSPHPSPRVAVATPAAPASPAVDASPVDASPVDASPVDGSPRDDRAAHPSGESRRRRL